MQKSPPWHVKSPASWARQRERKDISREMCIRDRGKAVKLENVTDKQGFHATMYIKFNPEKGRPYRYDTNPDKAQQDVYKRQTYT